MITQATTYATIPPTIPPGTTARIAQNRRTIVESTPRYSARPPHTPAIFESVAERIKRRWENAGRIRAPQYEQKFQCSSTSLLHSAQFMISSTKRSSAHHIIRQIERSAPILARCVERLSFQLFTPRLVKCRFDSRLRARFRSGSPITLALTKIAVAKGSARHQFSTGTIGYLFSNIASNLEPGIRFGLT